MRVYLDDQPVAVEGAGFPVALAAARQAAQARGRVIVEAKLDGRDLVDRELDGEGDPAGDELRTVSADPRALVAYSFREVAGSIPDLRAAQSAAAAKLQTGQFEPALTQLSDALAAWEALRRVVDDGPRLLGIDLRSLIIPAGGPVPAGVAVAQEIDRLAAILAQMQQALRAQDWSDLADLLEGELDEAAARWDHTLTVLAPVLAGGATPGGPG